MSPVAVALVGQHRDTGVDDQEQERVQEPEAPLAPPQVARGAGASPVIQLKR